MTHRDVFEEVNGIILDVVCDEEVICYSQESHLRNGEDIHELLHLWSLWGGKKKKKMQVNV